MDLPRLNTKHISTVSHEGKVLIVVTVVEDGMVTLHKAPSYPKFPAELKMEGVRYELLFMEAERKASGSNRQDRE